NGCIHARVVGGTACLEHAVYPNGLPECRGATRRHDVEAHSFENLEREKSAVLPSAQPQSLGCQEHVLADRRRFAERVVAGLPLDDRQRQYPFGIEEPVPEPGLSAGWGSAVAVVDNAHTATRGCVTAQRRIDELCDQ